MKRNLIYSVFAALLLVSCSGNEDIPEPTPAPVPETLDAYLSLTLSNGIVKTKAATRTDDAVGDETTPPSYGDGGSSTDPAGTTAINSLTVAIFRGAPSAESTAAGDGATTTTTVSQPEGSLLYLNTFSTKEAINKDADGANKLCASKIVKDEDEYQINGIKIKAGNIHVLIMANMPADFPKDKTGLTMDKMKTLTYGDLEHEGFNNNNEDNTYPCSMSSKWLSYNVKPTTAENANNNVFYLFDGSAVQATESTAAQTTTVADQDRTFNAGTGNAIPLYRNVSAVAFKTVTLTPSEGWGKKNGATLTLKSVFVTNAISTTSMTVGTEIKSPAYFCGHNQYRGAGKDAVLATVKNENKSYLIKAWNTSNPKIKVSGNASNDPIVSAVLPTDDSKATCVGKYFMVYENSQAMGVAVGKQTLLVLCADYAYTDDQGESHTLKDRFYTVVVNDESNTGTSGSNTGYGSYVNRNYIYNVNLTVVGPGSVNPYIPLYTANATAFVEAAAWNGSVEINQPAE